MKLETIPGKIDEFRLTYGAFPGKIIRRRKFHQDVWTVQIRKPDSDAVIAQEDFSTFEFCFMRASQITQAEVDQFENDHNELMADIGEDTIEEDVA